MSKEKVIKRREKLLRESYVKNTASRTANENSYLLLNVNGFYLTDLLEFYFLVIGKQSYTNLMLKEFEQF